MANTNSSEKKEPKTKKTTKKKSSTSTNSKTVTTRKKSNTSSSAKSSTTRKASTTTTKKNTNSTKKVTKPVEKKIEETKVEVKEPQNTINTSKIISVILILLSIIIIILSVSFGFFTYARSGRQQSSIYTANLNIVVNDEESLGISDTNSFPVYDEVGRETDPYEFTLENLGSVAANYVMKLVPDTEAISKDLCSDNLLADESLKIQLIKDGVVVKESRISELDDYVIDSGFIGLVDGVNSYSYELRMWIASDAGKEIMGRHYHGKIQVEVIDPNNG